jgi:hypothetical protein
MVFCRICTGNISSYILVKLISSAAIAARSSSGAFYGHFNDRSLPSSTSPVQSCEINVGGLIIRSSHCAESSGGSGSSRRPAAMISL